MGSQSAEEEYGFDDLPTWLQVSVLLVVAVYVSWYFLPVWQFALVWVGFGVLVVGLGVLYVQEEGSLSNAIRSLRSAWEVRQEEINKAEPLTSYQSSKLKSAVGLRCEVPGCTTQRSLHVHHITPRSEGGGNELSNLIVLCRNHHADCDNGAFSRTQQREIIRGNRFHDEEIKEYWRSSVGSG